MCGQVNRQTRTESNQLGDKKSVGEVRGWLRENVRRIRLNRLTLCKTEGGAEEDGKRM